MSLAFLAGTAHADDVAFKVTDSVSVKGKDIPYSLYLTPSEMSDTQLGVEAFLDLRSLEKNAVDFSNILKETCKQKFALADTETAAEGDALTVDGQFQAKFYACDTDDPKVHYRGVLLFGQNVDVVVKAGADA